MTTTNTLYDTPGPRIMRRHRIIGAAGTMGFAVLVAAVLWRLDVRGQFDATKWVPFTDPDILGGVAKAFSATVQAAVAAIVLALVIGTVLARSRLSARRFIQLPAVAIIEFFRATPVLLLVLALALFNGSVLAEIIRAGILAVPRGQIEAASAIGLRGAQITTLILLPQAIRTMLPAIISQCVVALKDTTLGFVIAYEELVRTGQLIYTGYHNILPTTFVISAIYVTMNVILSRIGVSLERQRSRPRRGRRQPPMISRLTTLAGPGRGGRMFRAGRRHSA
jgi:glutamate transport system permease protein